MSTLIDASLVWRTRVAYDRSAQEFTEFVCGNEWAISSASDLDMALVHYCEHKFGLAYAPAAGHSAVAAMNRIYPNWKYQLPYTKLALKGWGRLMPPKKRPPLTWPLTCAIALRAVSWGYPNVAIAVLLGFHCYLRIGELLGIAVTDVADVGDPRAGFGNAQMFVRLAQTKTGPNQDVVVYNPAVAALVRLQLATRKPDELLFGVSEREFRLVFRKACVSWGLPPSIVPHSMRHGGATHAFVVDGVDAATIKVRGRWKSDDSFRTYIQTMRSALITSHAPAETVSFGKYASVDIVSSFYFSLSISYPTPYSSAATAAAARLIDI